MVLKPGEEERGFLLRPKVIMAQKAVFIKQQQKQLTRHSFIHIATGRLKRGNSDHSGL